MKRLMLGLLLWLAVVAGTANAHALDPGYLDLSALGQDRWRVTWRMPDVSGRPMPIDAALPDNCAGDAPPPVFDGRAWTTGWLVNCPGGLQGRDIRIEGLEKTRTETLVRYELEPGEAHVRRLTSSESGFTVPADAGVVQILTSYVALGVTHILEGVDHLLFVFALLLLVGWGRRLFWAVTAFTVAHSLTLAAAVMGWLNVPSQPVEAIIALSIVFLAYELALPRGRRDPIAERWPWVVSFGFGLIHGLGFAGALREIGLPENDIPLALFAFNVGVELGQILFIGVVATTFAVIVRLYPVLRSTLPRIVHVTSYAIGGVAAFWVIERLAAF